MLVRRIVGIAVFISASCLCCGTLLAQDHTPAASHTNKAVGDKDRQPNPLRQLEIARAYERLDDISASLAAYREYLQQADPATDREQRNDAQGRVVALAARLAERGLQQVSVQTTPRGAAVLLDGKALGSSPFYVDLKPGSHRIEFRLAGYQAAAYEFELPPHQPLNIAVGLVADRGGVAAVAKDAAPAAASVAAPAAGAGAGAPAASAPASSPSAKSGRAPSEAAASEPDAAPGAVSVASAAGDAASRKTMRTLGFVALGSSVAALGGAMALEESCAARARATRVRSASRSASHGHSTRCTAGRPPPAWSRGSQPRSL